MRSGRFDGVSARGDVGGQLIADRYVDPVNTDLVPSYEDFFEGLRRKGSQIVDGVRYGVPQGRFPNLLMWSTTEVRTDPEEEPSSDLIFDPELASRYERRVSILDSPMSIADAALYLREHEPELGIENVYELDQEQFDAAVELLREQRPFIGDYWRDPSENTRAFARGTSVAGTAWLVSATSLQRSGVRVRALVPKEETTGFSDTWMLSSNASHPNCMYRWMDWISGPRANAAVAVRTHQAPANERACNLVPIHCDVYRAADENLFDAVHYWTTPLRDCGDGRGDVCKTYDEWARAFAEVRAER
jgi:putative spermidine/putrescine transport system substrate-binding protein